MRKRNLLTALCLCITVAGLLTAQNQAGSRRILIAYFTMPETDGVDAVAGASRLVINGTVTGNIRFVANTIQRATGGDLFAIQPLRTYPSGQALREAARNEQRTNARPQLATRISSLQEYDTVFLGYPIWWYDLPMPLYSFLEEYNFAGKTIIPFTVHSGSRLSGTVERISILQPQATVITDGLAISRNNLANSERDVIAWLRRLGY